MKRIKIITTDNTKGWGKAKIITAEDGESFKPDIDELVTSLVSSVDQMKAFRSGWKGIYLGYSLNEEKDELFFHEGGKICGAKNIIGTIRNEIKYGSETIDLTLEVRSRFDTLDRPWFAAAMLSTIVEDSEGIASQSEIYNGETDIFGFMKAVLFAKYLERAYKAGIYRPYVRNEYNNSRPRGSLDIARHLRLNLARKDRVAYVTRERDENNPLNRLIMHTWRYLKSKFPAVSGALDKNTLHRALGELQAYTASSNDSVSKCVMQNLHPITGPYYTDYEKLRKLCLSILRDENVNANIYGDTAADEFAHGITFYVPDLWEMYLERYIKNGLGGTYLEAQCNSYVYSKADIDLRKGGSIGFCNQHIRPDYVFFKEKNGSAVMVLDAKYRKWDNNSNDDGLPWEKKPADMDDFDKLLRDMVCFNTKACGIIYPAKNISETKAELHSLSEMNPDIHIYIIRVGIPDTSGEELTYTEWLSKFEASFSKVQEALDKKLEYELDEKLKHEKAVR